MRTSLEHVVNQSTYAKKIYRWETYVVVTIYVHQIAYAMGKYRRTSGKYVRHRVSYNARRHTGGNAYVAENTYITGRCTSSKCTYARKVRTSSISRYVSRISVTENVVGISLTESTVGTRLFAQTSNGPKCSRMLPKQYHFETLK